MGGGKSTTVVSTPPPTESELQLQRRQVELAEFQLDALKEQQSFQKQLYDLAGPAFAAQSRLLNEALADLPDPGSPEYKARRAKIQELDDLSLDMQLESLRAGGGATARELEAIRGATDASLEAGSRDISRFEDEAIRALTEELAPRLGLRSTDSPIVDRAARIKSEGLRQRGDLTAKLRASEQLARLNAPLAGQQFLGAVGEARSRLTDAATSFQADLRESAALNRLGLASGFGQISGNAGKFGLGLATGVPFDIGAATQGMRSERMANATTTGRKSPGVTDYVSGAGQLFGGIGGLASGLSVLSSRELKDIVHTLVPGNVEHALRAIVALQLYHYHYKADSGLPPVPLHIGPMAEDWHEKTGTGDGKIIPMQDAIGFLMAAVQAIDQRLKDHGMQIAELREEVE